MRATVTIEKEVLDELVKATGARSKSAAVKKIIDEHHGKIDILTARGQGTTFFIKLPEFKKEE